MKLTREELSIVRRAASIWGRLGGSSKSEAKTSAARINGQYGGRPRKSSKIVAVPDPKRGGFTEFTPRARNQSKPKK